jgi:uncharacterized protein
VKALRFAWRIDKEASNRRKHGVSFEEAKSAFYNDNARIIPDSDHSQDEDRFILLGLGDRLRVLFAILQNICLAFSELFYSGSG